MDLVEVLKILGDENRIRILNILKEDAICVYEIESILGLNQSNVSRHLTRLTSCKLIKSYKKAQYVYYRINEEILEKHKFIRNILDEEVLNIDKCIKDTETLLEYKNKNLTCEDFANNAVK
ncbi:metalloregulator ArsR/SmtB family transcription factor [Clostridium sp.]|uniref:ArsR/SmtB family transcription factor n=1 Tax=Clostridium sp. TaxID=1506 RepID=UPI002FCAB426